ncbi:hypothetical protein KC960_00315 [Candidatus Saccharibacteria bacterium]|nr:hypothetical protein [Candidatus Saccharibacteria bacterium]
MQDKIRNFAIIAQVERFAYKTPLRGFSSRGEVNKLLRPATLPEDKQNAR